MSFKPEVSTDGGRTFHQNALAFAVAGFTIVLHSNGTWKALADVIVGEGAAP